MNPKFNFNRRSVVFALTTAVIAAAILFIVFNVERMTPKTIVETADTPLSSSVFKTAVRETDTSSVKEENAAFRRESGESGANENDTVRNSASPVKSALESNNRNEQLSNESARQNPGFNELPQTGPKSARVVAALTILERLGIEPLIDNLAAREKTEEYESTEENEEAEGLNPIEATKFRNLQLQDENGKIPLDGLQKARRQMDRMRAAESNRAKRINQTDGVEVAGINPGAWAWLGPGNVGGRIRSIVIDPTNANKMFVGSVSGGIWTTTNAGISWSPVNDFMANLAVSTMVMDPTNPNIIYAGTGESFAADRSATEGEGIAPDGLRGDGIFKTTDGGATWNQLARTRTADPTVCAAAGPICAWSYVDRLTISPDGAVILAATVSGIQRSTDGGATWNAAVGAVGRFTDVDFDPANPLNAIAAGAAGSIFSTNGGLNWQNAVYAPVVVPAGGSGRVELAYAPSNPQIVYASVDQYRLVPAPPAPQVPAVQGDVFLSNDGGRNFTRLNTVLPGNTFLGSQGFYDNIIWVNPQNPAVVIVGGINIYRSTDGGINWTAIANGGNGSAHSDHHMIVAHPGFNNAANKTVYFSNDGGIYRADDVSTVSLTSGWTKLNNNLGITQFYGAGANDSGMIVGGTQDNGTLKYSGDAQNWTTMFGGDGGYSAADPSDPNYFYGEYTNLGIVRSSNGGASASYIYCNPVPTSANGGVCGGTGIGILDSFNGANFIAPFVLDPNNSNRMLAGGLSLWRSNDIKASGLPTWTAIKPPLSDGLIPPSNVPISAVAVSPNNADFIVVGHNFGQMFVTFDGTSAAPTWSRISNPAITPNRFVTRLVIDETRSPNWIYATFGGFAADNVYVTKDLGGTWTDVTGTGANGLPNVPVRSLAISPANPSFIYVGTEVGIFASEDGGATWRLPQDGPANVSVDELFWTKGNLAAVTHGRGLYKTSTAVYNLPLCAAPADCTCFGKWNCPCSWSSNTVPTVNDDVAISCPITVTPSAPIERQARNMRVNSLLKLESDLGIVGNVVNFGNISSQIGSQSSLSVGSLQNSKPPNTITLGGEIFLLGGLTATGDVTNAGNGIIAVGTDFNTAGLSTSAGSTTTMNVLRVGGNLINKGYTEARGTGGISVQGNIANDGSLIAPLLATNGAQHDFSGAGLWQFGVYSLPGGPGNLPQTVSLGSDVTFDITEFSNNGTLDFRDKTLNFKGASFQGAGAVAGTGTLRFIPSSGNALFNANGPVVNIASGTVECQAGITVKSLIVDAATTFAMNFCNVTATGDVTNNGAINRLNDANFKFNGETFTNNGSIGAIDFLTFNDGNGPPVQFITGAGSWSPSIVTFGLAQSTARVNLLNNVTFNSDQIRSSTLDVGNFTMTLNGSMNFFTGRVFGTGSIKMQPVGGSPRLGTQFGALTLDPALEIAAGTVRASTAIVRGKLTVAPGATLSLSDFGVEATGDVINDGTINAAPGGISAFRFKGGTFTNNSLINGNLYVNFGDSFGSPIVQNLAGNGSWAGSPRLFIDSLSTVNLQSDVAYDGANLYVEGRVNTGAFALSLPCNTIWSGAGDVFGNIRRTNLAACPGAAFAFGNPFTTIQFFSGTAPSEITVNVLPGVPAGFSNAINRTYLITPTGGSGYTATLRLHYLDSELRGNLESNLQLWRNDGTNWTPQGATSRDSNQNWVEYAGVTQFSPWTISSASLPTAASVMVGGRVVTASGRGIRNARVTMTSPNGEVRVVGSNPFGYFRFAEVAAGETYIFSISAKGYRFAEPVQVRTIFAETADLNFVAVAPLTDKLF